MRVRTCLASIALAAGLGFGLSAQNSQEVLPHGAEEVRLLRDLYLEAGLVPLSLAEPFTVDELAGMLERIDPSRLSPAGRRTWDHVKASLVPREVAPEGAAPGQGRPREAEPGMAEAASTSGPGLAVQARPAATAELYLHTNASSTFWPYGYNEREPLIALPLELWGGRHLFAAARAELRQVHDAVEGIGGVPLTPPVVSSWPADQRYIDWEQPFRALVSVGGSGWSFAIGRDRFSWGGAWSGSLVLSDAADYQEFARITGYWRSFKYTAMLIGLDSELNGAGYGAPATDPTTVYHDYPRSYLLHRFEWLPTAWLQVSVTEGILKGGNLPDLRYLNPLAIFHNFFHWNDSSSILSVEARASPLPSLALYGQAAINAFNSPFEQLYWPGALKVMPDAFAWLAGIETALGVGQGYLEGGSEIGYTSPWMYLRESLLTSYSWDRYQTSNVPGSPQWVIRPLGYPLGPDAIELAFWAGWRVPGYLRASADLALQWKGENNVGMILVQNEQAAALTTPSGTAERRAILGLHGQGAVRPWFSLGADLYGIWIENHGHLSGVSLQDFQAVLRAGFHLSASH